MNPRNVHLVGSIGLDSVAEVFRTVGGMLFSRLRRVPDGEPGGRRLWISWQYPLLRANPRLVVDGDPDRKSGTGFPLLCLADGVKPAELSFGELGYAREARASYEDFRAARARGELPSNARFQVCLPTPLAVIHAFCTRRHLGIIEEAYTKAMLREVSTLCDTLPHADLSIQWDVCIEMIMWDGRFEGFRKPGSNIEEEVLVRMKRLCETIPEDVELGIHLCYGDWEAKHFIEPIDAGKMVTLANALVHAISHPISYMHMPVPLDRKDEEFYKPLKDLALAPETELFLGCVHAADGVAGTNKRIEMASRYVKHFGIATECGMGRCKTPEAVRGLLEIHANTSGPA